MKITKAFWDSLPASPFKDAFKVNPNNADEFDNGEEAVGGLKSALEAEKAEKKQLGEKLAGFETAKLAEIEAARKKAIEEARSSGDFAAIEADYQKQLKELRDKVANQEATRNADLTKAAIDAAASELAKDFVTPALALPAIKERLKAEIVDGKAIVRVLDKNGAASAMDVSSLRNEFLTTPELKASLVASKGGGGGSTQVPGGGGSPSEAGKDFNPVTAKGKELVAHIKATNPAMANLATDG